MGLESDQRPLVRRARWTKVHAYPPPISSEEERGLPPGPVSPTAPAPPGAIQPQRRRAPMQRMPRIDSALRDWTNRQGPLKVLVI